MSSREEEEEKDEERIVVPNGEGRVSNCNCCHDDCDVLAASNRDQQHDDDNDRLSRFAAPNQKHPNHQNNQNNNNSINNNSINNNNINNELNPPLVAATLIPAIVTATATAQEANDTSSRITETTPYVLANAFTTANEADPEWGHHSRPVVPLYQHEAPPPSATTTATPSVATTRRSFSRSSSSSFSSTSAVSSNVARLHIEEQTIHHATPSAAPTTTTTATPMELPLDSSPSPDHQNPVTMARNMQPTPRLYNVQQVRFDALEEDSTGNVVESSQNSSVIGIMNGTNNRSNNHGDRDDESSNMSAVTFKSFDRRFYKRLCLWGSMYFFLGCVVMALFAFAIFKWSPPGRSQQQTPIIFVIPTPSPVSPAPASTRPSILAAPTIVASNPATSLSPSSAPSCSGLYMSSWSSPVPSYAGTMRLALSDDGMTMVVAHYEYSSQLHYLETHDFQNSVSFRQAEGYYIVDMTLSGDGSTLVLGLSAFREAHDDSTVVGGACLVLKRSPTEDAWYVKHQIITGGGRYGQVSNVAASYNGSTVALVAGVLLEDMNVRVFRTVAGNGTETTMHPLGDPLVSSMSVVDDTTRVLLSGDGNRLFVATTTDGRIHTLEYEETAGWTGMGGSNSIQTISTVASNNGGVAGVGGSFDMTTTQDGSLLVVAVSSDSGVPVTVYEFHAMEWHAFARLDIQDTAISSFPASPSSLHPSKHVAISGDGRNIVLLEPTSTTASQQDGDETFLFLARWFHRSGNVFAPIQDWSLPKSTENTIVRAMVLDPSGEQLVLALGNDVVMGFRKDCPNKNTNRGPTL